MSLYVNFNTTGTVGTTISLFFKLKLRKMYIAIFVTIRGRLFFPFFLHGLPCKWKTMSRRLPRLSDDICEIFYYYL